MAVDRKKFCRQLVGVHSAAALLFKNPIIAIREEEGESLGNAIMDVLEHYEVTLSPVVLAWLNLAGVSAMVYGPKIAMLAMQKRKERASHLTPVHVDSRVNPNAVKTAPVGNVKPVQYIDGLPVV